MFEVNYEDYDIIEKNDYIFKVCATDNKNYQVAFAETEEYLELHEKLELLNEYMSNGVADLTEEIENINQQIKELEEKNNTFEEIPSFIIDTTSETWLIFDEKLRAMWSYARLQKRRQSTKT